MRRYFLIIFILALSSLACSLITQTTPASTPLPQPSQTSGSAVISNTSTPEPAGSQTPVPQGTSEATKEEPTKTPYPTSVLDSSMRDVINLIQTQVVNERTLKPKELVPVVLLNSSQLRTNVVNDFIADYTDEDLADDIYELSIIGLLEPNFDLRTLYINLLSEQIAGYYDDEMKEMFVVGDQGFNGPEHLTYSHEYTHVLQDQTYDIEKGLKYNDDYCENNTEYCAAVQALIEGDATLSEYTWYQNYATTTDQAQVQQFYNNLKSPVYDSAPAFLKDDFVFPYTQGLTFVQYYHGLGGWAKIDEIYKNPPVTTEQILHPELYPSDTPIPVQLPDLSSTLGTGWREVSHNVMGEWYTYLILARGVNQATRLDDPTAKAAAAGWGGDEYAVLHNDTSKLTAFVMKDIWDTTTDASQFSDALQKSLNARFGVTATQQGNTFTWAFSGGYSSFLVSGATTIWIITPDAATAQLISAVVTP